MLGQLNDESILEDDGIRVEDSFRRAAFSWAVSTKRLVESSAGITPRTRVAYAALVDIEYARDLLDTLFIPSASKVPAGVTDRATTVTVDSVKESVSGLAKRIATTPIYLVPDPKTVKAKEGKQVHRGSDMSLPVYPKNGKMMWAGFDCPQCPSKATQRCQKDDGEFMEKPHTPRKNLADQA